MASSREEKIEPRTPPQTIDLIYKLAKEKNKAALAELFSSKVLINLRHRNETAVQRLASEKELDQEALELLIDFKANLNDAVKGAAIARHDDLMEALLGRGASLPHAALGAVIGGHFDLMENLIVRGVSVNDMVKDVASTGCRKVMEDLISRGALLTYALCGAALGGHKDLVEDLLARGASLSNVAAGAAQRGDRDLAENFISQGASVNEVVFSVARNGDRKWAEDLISRGASLDEAVAGAAICGDREWVYELIKRGATLDKAVMGAAHGSHWDWVDELLDQGAAVKDAVIGAAQAGHRLLVKHLLTRGGLLRDASIGAAIGGQFAFSKDLISQGASLFSVVRGAEEGEYFTNNALTVQWFSFFEEPLRKDLARQAAQLSNITVNITLLSQKTEILTDLARTKKITINQGLTWETPEIQRVLLFLRIARYLPNQFYFLIASFAFPLEINEKEMSDLFLKMRFEIRKTDLTVDLNQYHLASSHYALFRHKKSFNFKKVCEEVQSDDRLDEVLTKEIELAPKGSYLELLQTHCPRK